MMIAIISLWIDREGNSEASAEFGDFTSKMTIQIPSKRKSTIPLLQEFLRPFHLSSFCSRIPRNTWM